MKSDIWAPPYTQNSMILTPSEYSTVRLGVESGSSYRSIESLTIRGHPYPVLRFFRAMIGEQGRGRWREGWETGAEGGVDGWMGSRDGGRTGVMPQGAAGWGSEGESAELKMMNSAWNTASGHLYTAIQPQQPSAHTHTRTHGQTVYQNYPKPVI